MVRFQCSGRAALAALFLVAVSGSSAPADGASTLYALTTPPSALEVGCQGPCECPVVSLPTYGSFSLVSASVDPLYANYYVQNFIASFNNGPGAVAITGSGTYRVGGEVALSQQLVLDLVVQGGPPQHFDSGLVPVTVVAPRISISCAVNGFYCYDSVLVVDAKVAEPAGVTTPPAPGRLQAARPNPFRGQTDVAFVLGQAGPVELTVLDLSGRRVRTLASGQVFRAGERNVIWEGRRDDGREAPAGVYWVVLRFGGGIERRRIVKLD